jgi:hypothetical protein
MKENKSNNELIQAITNKVSKANPMVKKLFLSSLKNKTKRELEKILATVQVSNDGYDINIL